MIFHFNVKNTLWDNNMVLGHYNKIKEQDNSMILAYGQLNQKSIVSGFNTGSYP